MSVVYPCPHGAEVFCTDCEPRGGVDAFAGLRIIGGRIDAIREVCQTHRNPDGMDAVGGWTEREWLAQTILNILDGNIDDQLREKS
mgnify:FL=1